MMKKFIQLFSLALLVSPVCAKKNKDHGRKKKEHPCIDWNTFCFQGCTMPASAVIDPTDPTQRDKYDKMRKLQLSTFELCLQENIGHYIDMGDQIYSDETLRSGVPVHFGYIVDYIDANALYFLYVDPATNQVYPEYQDVALVIYNPLFNEDTLWLLKTPRYYDALYPNGIDNLLENKKFQWKELMNTKTARQLRSRIGSRNFLYCPDDHDWEISDTADSLSVIAQQTYALAEKYMFNNDRCHPQVIQMNERRKKGNDNPGFYYTVAYELYPGKFVQLVGFDERTQAIGSVIQMRRDRTTGEITYYAMANSGGNNYNPLLPPEVAEMFTRTYAKQATTLGKNQLLWLRDVLQKDGKVPAYSKEGKYLGYSLNQDQIYFRCLIGNTTLISGAGFRDRLSTQETSILYHLFNGGDIVDDPNGVVTPIDPLNYEGKEAVRGILCLESGNHHFDGFRTDSSTPLNQTVEPDINGIIPPYTIYSYAMSNWTSDEGVVGPITLNSINTLDSAAAFRYDERFRRTFTTGDYINQPSAITITFDLEKDGFEKAFVKAVSWGNQNIFPQQTDSPEYVLDNSAFNVKPYSLMEDTLVYEQLRKAPAAVTAADKE